MWYIKTDVFVQYQISQKYWQIVPTPCGSILQPSRTSQLPYNAKNKCLAGFLAFRQIPYISPIIPLKGPPIMC